MPAVSAAAPAFSLDSRLEGDTIPIGDFASALVERAAALFAAA